uniref:Uncharacterized protein n=1 Tax=Cacopsylla melanoneura TaxID=428564 RepID=A0A8D8ZE55_9HEMI
MRIMISFVNMISLFFFLCLHAPMQLSLLLYTTLVITVIRHNFLFFLCFYALQIIDSSLFPLFSLSFLLLVLWIFKSNSIVFFLVHSSVFGFVSIACFLILF